MPTYQSIKTYRAGFYDAKNRDRTYSARDMRKPYDTVFSDGILPIADGSVGDAFKVSKVADMEIIVGAGEGKVGGAWFENTDDFRIVLDDADAVDRYDCVILRNDDNEDVRAPLIYVKSLNHVPTAEDLERNDLAYEFCVAYVYIPAFSADGINANNIIDTRDDGILCRAMTGVGAIVIQTFRNTYFTESAGQMEIPIGIGQYNKNRDRLTVVVEGRVFAEDMDYTIVNNNYIKMTIGFPVVKTKVEFEVAKNVNGKGAETVIQEVADLLKKTASIDKTLEHHYYCNGVNDNVLISDIAQTYLNAGSDYRSMRLVVHGTFGAYGPYSGEGNGTRNYFWMALGKDGVSTNRRLIVDFTDCTSITLPITVGTYNTVFAGNDVHVVGANVVANQSGANTYIRMFSSANGVVVAEDCRFWITATLTSYISQTGTFIRCRGSVTVSGAAAYCFYATDASLLRVQGGEYYAYSTVNSAVVYQTHANAVVILYAMNCPTNARSGYTQNYAVNCSGKNVSITDTITALPVNVPNGNIRGTLEISKAGLM